MTDREAREMRIQGLLNAGFSREEAEISDDLGIHAAMEATKTVVRICDTAPTNDTRICARVTAMQILEVSTEGALNRMKEQALQALKDGNMVN